MFRYVRWFLKSTAWLAFGLVNLAVFYCLYLYNIEGLMVLAVCFEFIAVLRLTHVRGNTDG